MNHPQMTQITQNKKPETRNQKRETRTQFRRLDSIRYKNVESIFDFMHLMQPAKS